MERHEHETNKRRKQSTRTCLSSPSPRRMANPWTLARTRSPTDVASWNLGTSLRLGEREVNPQGKETRYGQQTFEFSDPYLADWFVERR
jgi:hypothetical protein